MDRLPGYLPAFGPAEIDDERRDVLRFGNALQQVREGAGPDHFLEREIAGPIENHRGSRRSGHDRIHVDAMLAELGRGGPCETQDARFGGRITGGGLRPESGTRGDVDVARGKTAG